MRFLSRRAFLAALVGLLVFAIAAPVLAAETSNSEFVIIPADDVMDDDLYAGAIRVVVEGTLDGDLIAFAAEEVVINGTVTGSVTAIAPRLTINGTVEQSVRFTGQTLDISGNVDGDVVGVAWRAQLGPDSNVAGDVLIWAWNVEAAGKIGQDLTGSQRHLQLAGEVSGDVDVSVTQLTVTGPLLVGGDLGYRSARDAEGLDQADVNGAIVSKTPLPPNLRVRALTLLGRLMVILFLSVAALTAAYGWPQRTARAVASISVRPIRKWLVGAALIFSPLIALAIAAVIVGLAPAAASFPLLAVFLPVILALTGLSLALGLIAGVPVVGFLGGILFKRFDLFGSILAGSIVVGVVWLLPWVGWLIPLVVLPLGLGAWLAGLSQSSALEPSV